MTGADSAALRDTTPRGRRRKKVHSQSPAPAPVAQPVEAEVEPGLRAGWRVIAAKEFTDHVLSIRFLVLTIILGLAAAAAVYATAGAIRDVASDATGTPSLFLKLFTVSRGDIPPFTNFIAFLGPLLGIAFGFDAINGERAEGTLPRLLSQPIHRDDVINGKYVAGLSAITVIFIAITAVVAAIGIIQLGILPQPEEVIRLFLWIGIAVAYVGVWLALALLCSVVIRRAATSALVAIAVWLLLTLFAALLVGLLVNVIAPTPPNASTAQTIASLSLEQNLARLSPSQLFTEATRALLDPSVKTFDIASLVQVANEQRALPSAPLSLFQSVLVFWPQLVALVAVNAVLFAIAYVAFMRQEVRA